MMSEEILFDPDWRESGLLTEDDNMDLKQEIWLWFKQHSKFTDYAIAGIMGNIEAESSCESCRLQGDFDVSRKKSKDYAAAVDYGAKSISMASGDAKGWGLCQWTYHARKRALFEYCVDTSQSIGSQTAQLEFLMAEMETPEYQNLKRTLESATSIRAASDAVLTIYERPANMGESVKVTRASYGEKFYNQYHGISIAQIKPTAEQVTDEIIAKIRPIILDKVKEYLK